MKFPYLVLTLVDKPQPDEQDKSQDEDTLLGLVKLIGPFMEEGKYRDTQRLKNGYTDSTVVLNEDS